MNLKNRDYNTILTETVNYFAQQGISVFGRGFEEVISNSVLYENYRDSLLEGASANSRDVMEALMANEQKKLLTETFTGLAPLTSLSMPVIRKVWPKFAVKEAIRTQVADKPTFTIPYMKPYLQAADGSKIYLPNGLTQNGLKGVTKEFVDGTIMLANGSAVEKSWAADAKVNLTGSSSNIKLQHLDELHMIGANVYVVTTDATAIAGKDYFTVANGGTVNAVYTKATLATGDALNGTPGTHFEMSKVTFNKKLGIDGYQTFDIGTSQLIVKFDGRARKATLILVNASDKDVEVSVKAAVSSEYNESAYSLQFDVLRQDITIPSGVHINSPLTTEDIKDSMALYQIDTTKEVIELMTDVFGMNLDLELAEFLFNSLSNRPNNFEFNDYGNVKDFEFTFDCKPAAGYAGGNKEWREQLKPLIDFAATKIKNETKFSAGMFAIVGNPLDINLITNIDWAFRGGQGSAVDGVEVDYSLGTYVGTHTYKIVASQNVDPGLIFIVFTPASEKQMTYTYYPYTFSTEQGYIDPNRSRVPSVMMTKRHTYHEFQPAIAGIVIENNGDGMFNTFVPFKAIT